MKTRTRLTTLLIALGAMAPLHAEDLDRTALPIQEPLRKTTAVCSPTRTALKSGRNHHVNNMGGIIETGTAFCGAISIAMSTPLPLAPIQEAMKDRTGAFVIIDCTSGEITDFDSKASAEKLPPCSTFKIWNALLAIEEGILSSPEQLFYRWDGIHREITAWNQDLNLRDAFQASCVPAFQTLANRLGPDRMNRWLDIIGYGDKNTSAGIDAFWLPAPDRRTILISPKEQAELLRKLVSGKLPVKPTSLQTLKDLMRSAKHPPQPCMARLAAAPSPPTVPNSAGSSASSSRANAASPSRSPP